MGRRGRGEGRGTGLIRSPDWRHFCNEDIVKARDKWGICVCREETARQSGRNGIGEGGDEEIHGSPWEVNGCWSNPDSTKDDAWCGRQVCHLSSHSDRG